MSTEGSFSNLKANYCLVLMVEAISYRLVLEKSIVNESRKLIFKGL